MLAVRVYGCASRRNLGPLATAAAPEPDVIADTPRSQHLTQTTRRLIVLGAAAYSLIPGVAFAQ
jgi:hypothetical protein